METFAQVRRRRARVLARAALLAPAAALLAAALLPPPAAAQSVRQPDPNNLGAYSIAGSSQYSAAESAGQSLGDFGGCSYGYAWTTGGYNQDGSYGGGTTTQAGGRTFSGEWVEFCGPGTATIDFAAFRLMSSRSPPRTPTSAVILGSNDDATWTVASEHYGSLGPWTSTCSEIAFARNSTSRAAFRCYRMVVLAHGSGDSWMSINAFSIFSNTCPSNSVTPPGGATCSACAAPATASLFQDSCVAPTCAAGFGFNGSACAPCAGGAFSAGGAGAVCAACAGGRFSTDGISCNACAAGFGGPSGGTCAACAANAYSYGGTAACASCPAGAILVSAARGCAPSPLATSGPADSAFYLSGSAAEGAAAFSTIAQPAGVGFAAGPFGAAGGALTLTSGSYLSTVPAGALLAALPTGSAAWSASAWVKCAAPAMRAGVLEWGVAGDAQGGASRQAAVLAVVGTAQPSVTYSAPSSIASGFVSPGGLAVDIAGNVYVADNHTVVKIAPGGATSVIARGLDSPAGLAADAAGNVYVADTSSGAVYMITPTGVLSTVASGLYRPIGVAVDSKGNVFVVENFNAPGNVYKITPDGTVTVIASGFNWPSYVALDSASNVFITDSGNGMVWKITPDGTVLPLTGNMYYYPQGLAVNAAGDVFVVDPWFHPYMGTVKRLVPGTEVVQPGTAEAGRRMINVISGLTSPGGLAMDSAGNIFVTDSGNSVKKVSVTSTFVPACDSTWHHVAATYSSTPPAMSAFVDGALVSTTAQTITLPSAAASLRVGWSGDASVNSGSPFAGSLADLRLYARALAPAEVRALARPPPQGACAAVQGFATLAASDAANPLGYPVVVAPQSTCSLLARSSGSLRCSPAKLTTAYAGEPVFFVGRSEDIPLDLMSSGPVGGSCSA